MKNKFTGRKAVPVLITALVMAGFTAADAHAQMLSVPQAREIAFTMTRGGTVNGLQLVTDSGMGLVYHLVISNNATLYMVSINARTGDIFRFTAGQAASWVNPAPAAPPFVWPLAGRLTSDFGYRRSPITGARQFHGGIDIAAPRGTPVRAAMSGQVSRVGSNNVFGNYVIINHQAGFRTLYAHLHVVRVRSGANVAAGDRIGDVGSTGLSTGLSTGPHLHFEIHRNGARVNPGTLLR